MAKKLTATQRRVAEKYKHIIEALEIRETLGAGKINKRNSLKQDIKRLARKSKSIDNQIIQAQIDMKDARPLIREKHRNQNHLRSAKIDKYKLDLEVRTAGGFLNVGDRSIPVSTEPLTEEQQQVLNRLERSLEEYSTGEMYITKFYNDYGFDQVDELSLRLFAEGEGLI